MTFALASIHNILSSCCGEQGNIFAKIFHKDDQNDVPDTKPTSTPSSASNNKPNFANIAKPPNKFAGFTDKEAKYEDITWSQLPLSAHKAATAIGFDQNTWDDKVWLPIDDKHWHDLTPTERDACETLGWDAISWDHKYENQDWKDLPPHVKRAAEKLGFSEKIWDDDEEVECWEKGWEEFTKEEQRALHVLGWYVNTWD